jgi:hypothetical protein
MTCTFDEKYSVISQKNMSIIALFGEMGVLKKSALVIKPNDQNMKKAEGSGGFASARN